MLGPLVTCYLFLGGAGGGALVLICTLELLDRFPIGAPRDYLTHCQLQARGRLLCLASLCLGALCLWFDLGRPLNVTALLVSPMPSPLTIGFFSLLLSLLCAALLAAEKLLDLSFVPSAARTAVLVLGFLCGFVTTGYTGVLLGSSAAVLAWQSPLLPVLFILSALSSGFALLFAAAAFTNRTLSSRRLMGVLLDADTVLLMLEAAVLAAFVISALAEPSSASGAAALLCGELAPLFWGVLVAAGIAAPLLLERSPLRTEAARLLALALCVLAGAAALRYCVVALAAFYPSQIYAVSHYAGTVLFNE